MGGDDRFGRQVTRDVKPFVVERLPDDFFREVMLEGGVRELRSGNLTAAGSSGAI